MKQTLERFAWLCTTIPPLLHELKEADFSQKSSPDKWSKKEILGHLIDSATNNHQRFVRAQFEDSPNIAYDQNQWNAFSYHQHMLKTDVITFWAAYNKQLLELIKHIPENKLKNPVRINDHNHSLQFIIEDYVAHMEYHLKQILSY